MYGDAVVLGKGGSSFQAASVKRQDFVPKDTLVVFSGNEIFYLDYKQDTWANGDVESVFKSPLEIAENSSVIRVDGWTKESLLFTTGGVLESGCVLNWAFGLKFEQIDGKLTAYMS